MLVSHNPLTYSMKPSKVFQWQAQLRDLAQQRQQTGLWRAPKVTAEGLVDFSSNDYLGLSVHPHVMAAFQQGIQRYGCGSGGSPLLSGYHAPHQQLSEQLADWLGRDAVLLTSSGYAANHAVAAVFEHCSPRYYFDKRNHASMYDAIASHSREQFYRFRHNDVAHLQRQCTANVEADTLTVIASEGVFSMDGDGAPLDALVHVKRQLSHTALWLDDAHGVGVVGTDGAGVCAAYGQDDIDVVTATFGKAFGLGGAFVAGSQDFIEAAHQYARHYIYSTAFSAAQACAIQAALAVIRSEAQWREQLEQHIRFFNQSLLAQGWRTEVQNEQLQHAIQPIQIGDIQTTLELHQHLLAQGLQCVPIRPPTVPAGQTGLRVSLRATHTRQELIRLLHALGDASQWMPQGYKKRAH